ncbi:MAG: restriction endonuclease [Caulobacterales bacterium]|nr:restriction endonuclease [Caulobacterales bacterium]
MARSSSDKVGFVEGLFAVWVTAVLLISLTLAFWKGVPFLEAVKWSAVGVGGAMAAWGVRAFFRRLLQLGGGRGRSGGNRRPRVGPMLRQGERRAERLIKRHAAQLGRKRGHVRTLNEYGVVDEKAWRAARQKFIDQVILESLPDHVREVLKTRVDVRGRWAQRIEKVARAAEKRWAEEGTGLDFRPGMSGAEYEAFCAQILGEAGWRVFNKGDSADQGVDLIARKDKMTVAIQCKRYRSSVGNSAVQEIVAGKAMVGPNALAAVVSNAPYTRAAKELAMANRVLLLHHSDLPGLERLVRARPSLAKAA